MFVFLLPSDMGGVARLVLQSLRRKQRRAERQADAQADADDRTDGAQQPPDRDQSTHSTAQNSDADAAASGIPASSSSFSFAPAAASSFSCGCGPSLRTRVVSWTFALPADVAMPADDNEHPTTTTNAAPAAAVDTNGAAAAAAPWRVSLRPTRSSALRSAHTKLHVYDLCACTLLRRSAEEPRGDGTEVEPDVATDIDSETKAPQGQSAPPLPLPELGHAEEVARAFAQSSGGAASTGASSVPWGHGLNTTEALQRRWAAALAEGHRGLFVEADLRIRPVALRRAAAEEEEGGSAAAATTDSATSPAAAVAGRRYSLGDVILAHDSGVDGESFRSWFASLCALSHSGNDGEGAAVIGLKLDFKCLEAVAPVLAELRAVADAAAAAGTTAVASGALDGVTVGGGQLRPSAVLPLPLFLSRPSFLWLNADVLAGPGCDQPTIDAVPFLALCQSYWPRAVLSLGWTTRPPPVQPHTQTADAHYYSDEDVSAMVSLLSPSAATRSASPSPSSSSPSPFPQCTFPVRASLVRRSWSLGSLQRLLAACPHSSLTVWTSREEQQRPDAADCERWIEENLPRASTFVDLRFD